jgi:hypothetical protein
MSAAMTVIVSQKYYFAFFVTDYSFACVELVIITGSTAVEQQQ